MIKLWRTGFVDKTPASDEEDDLVAGFLARDRLDASDGEPISLKDCMLRFDVDSEELAAMELEEESDFRLHPGVLSDLRDLTPADCAQVFTSRTVRQLSGHAPCPLARIPSAHQQRSRLLLNSCEAAGRVRGIRMEG
jgi:hypothetical protein